MKKLETIDEIKLEEMDWQNARRSTVEEIRSTKLKMDLNDKILELCNLRLEQLFKLLPEEEQERRNKLEESK